MKKAILSGVFIASFALYAIYQMFDSAEASAIGGTLIADNSTLQTASQKTSPTQSASQTTQSSAPSSPSRAPTPAQTPTPAPAPAPKPKGQYTDGTYTGSVADAYYGNVQVQATISGGKLSNVTFLQYPNDRSYSLYVNGQAMPYLTQEAIAAQSANVDGVSGASETSGAFVQSLSSALQQAKA